MKRRRLLAGTALLLAAPRIALAQAAKLHRVGLVTVLSRSPEPSTVRAFRQAMRELGYVEGRNLVLEVRFAEGRLERLPEIYADLIRLKSEVIVTGSAASVLAAKKATSTVPIVFAGVLDAVTPGIVTNLARPGGNVTGATYGVGPSGIAGKWLEVLKEAAPAVSHVAVLVSSVDPQYTQLLGEIQGAALRLKVRIEVFDAKDDATLDKAFAAIRSSRAQGLIVTNSPYFSANHIKIVGFAAERRLPAVYFFNLFVDAGGLMSYGGSVQDSYRRAAGYVDKVLKGARPGDLPVDQATKFELVVNLKTAKALGLKIPHPMLVRADRVIE